MWLPEIVPAPERKVVGIHETMSMATFNPGALWRNFMPRQREIGNRSSGQLISMSLYDKGYFSAFHADAPFEKWACAEVRKFDEISGGMDLFTIPAGLYALFHYKGLNTDYSVFDYIFSKWLPQSGFEPDARPHYEILGDKYRNNDPDSEEDIYVPVKKKGG